ncbi:MAG: precorrin-8X methylmutase, partial [Chloroflexaceae bacterium]|nr:precorrin-8X methylmutase [Chloroflexaceae bacterium]
MEWTVSTAQSLAEIDREISLKDPANFSPAEYEIVRRVVLATADLDYWHLLRFSAQAMPAGAAALVARTPVVVDGPMLQAGLSAVLENTFGNPIYCSLEIPTRSRNGESQAAWGMRAFAERYPQGLFVVGQEASVLTVLMELLEAEKIAPTLVIGAPAGIV